MSTTPLSAFSPEAWWREETLHDWMDRTRRDASDRVALRTAGLTLTYGQLHARACDLATFFRSLGIRKGDVIAAQLPNSMEFILTYLAAGYLGAILQTVHMPYRGAELEPLLRHARAKAFVCLARTKDFEPAVMALSLRQPTTGLERVIAVGDDPPPGSIPFPLDGPSGGETTPIADASDLFLLLYTSGTMTAPKGVPIAYRKFLANARLSASEIGIDATSTLLSAAPFTHLYGLFSINLALAVGATTAILPAFSPTGFATALDALRPTGVFTAPAHMTACLAEGLLTPERLSGVRFLMISGSVCPPELAQTVQERMPNGKVLQLWGMSELQAGSFTRPDDALATRISSAGRASPGTELRITDGDTPLAAGQEGELQVRGCSVFGGYLANEDATSSAFTHDGWFRSGDLARMDTAGNILITGRLKEVINRGGVKFNPADVELVIGRHPAVQQCAIVPMPDAALGERACCFVVLRSDATLDLDALRIWLAQQQISKMKWPERLEIIDEMPMTPTRKIKKAELFRRVAGG